MSNTSWKNIAADLSSRIGSGELEAGSRLPPGEEIAAQWGVSRHTAHRAIHELQRQGLVVRQRRWGTVVAKRTVQETKRVTFVVDRFAPAYNFPSADIIRGIQDGLGEDIQVAIADCKGDWEVEMRQLQRAMKESDGVILCPTSNPKNTPLLQQMTRGGYPLVILDRVPDGVECDAVVSDNENVTLRALHDLEDRGHRRIAFFSFYKPNFSSVSERYSAYVKALSEVGVDDTAKYTRWFSQELDEFPQQFFQAIFDSLFTLLKQEEPVTALFCVQDSFAAAALQACERMGVAVPGTLELVTFNDWPPLMLRSPWNTHRIVQRHYEIGVTAGGLLKSRRNTPESAPQIVRVDADLVGSELSVRPIIA